MEHEEEVICHECDGDGRYEVPQETDPLGWTREWIMTDCPTCQGTGYLLITTWASEWDLELDLEEATL